MKTDNNTRIAGWKKTSHFPLRKVGA